MTGLSEVLNMKIEKGEPKRNTSKYKFHEMKVGEYIYYEGPRTKLPVAFASYLTKGKYETIRDGNGWRFYLRKRVVVHESNPSRFEFHKMKVGEYFYYEGPRSSAILAFGYYLAKDKYLTTKEGNGWKFHLKKK